MNILSYNFTTNEQLSSYEPKVIGIRTGEQNSGLISDNEESNPEIHETRDIFTLALLKDHSIIVKKESNMINVFCKATIVLPNTSEAINKQNERLINEFTFFELKLKDSERADLDYSNGVDGDSDLADLKKKRKRRSVEETIGENILSHDPRYFTTTLTIGPYKLGLVDNAVKHETFTCSLSLDEIIDIDQGYSQQAYNNTITRIIELNKFYANEYDDSEDIDDNLINNNDNGSSDKSKQDNQDDSYDTDDENKNSTFYLRRTTPKYRIVPVKSESTRSNLPHLFLFVSSSILNLFLVRYFLTQ